MSRRVGQILDAPREELDGVSSKAQQPVAWTAQQTSNTPATRCLTAAALVIVVDRQTLGLTRGSLA
jgi:hypothetical protein